jgi:hypothetical protein
MRTNSSIFLLTPFAIFNKDKTQIFESLDAHSSVHLYTTFMLNYKEILDPLRDKFSIHYCFDENDRNYLPDIFSVLNDKIIYFNSEEKPSFIKSLSEKYFGSYNSSIVLFSNSIGVTAEDILKTVTLLTTDEPAAVVGKAMKHKAAFIGFNNLAHFPAYENDFNEMDFDQIIYNASKHDIFLNVIGNYLVVKDLEDFKTLYIELSKKESLSYCSHSIHEQFTSLFIEYKDLLK